LRRRRRSAEIVLNAGRRPRPDSIRGEDHDLRPGEGHCHADGNTAR
jgi:hypothetical protein